MSTAELIHTYKGCRSHGVSTEQMLIDHPCAPLMKRCVRFVDCEFEEQSLQRRSLVHRTLAEPILDQPISSVGLPNALATEQEQARSVTWHRTIHPLPPVGQEYRLRAGTLQKEEQRRFSPDSAGLVTETAAPRADRRFVDRSQYQGSPRRVVSIVPVPVVLVLEEPIEASTAVAGASSRNGLESLQEELDECYRRFDKRYRGAPARDQSGYW